MLFVEILACKSKISVRLFQVSLTGGNGQDLSDANWNHFTLFSEQAQARNLRPVLSCYKISNVSCLLHALYACQLWLGYMHWLILY